MATLERGRRPSPGVPGAQPASQPSACPGKHACPASERPRRAARAAHLKGVVVLVRQRPRVRLPLRHHLRQQRHQLALAQQAAVLPAAASRARL